MTTLSRRGLLTAAAGLTAGIGLTGCLPDSTPSGGTGEGTVGGQIDVAWWGGESRNAKTNAVIDLFKAEFPDVTTTTQSADYAQYFNRLNVQAASRSLPDVVQMQDRQVNDYTKRETLLALDEMVEAGTIDTSKIPAAVLDGGRGSDGKLYFLPYGIAWDCVMVNMTLAEAAGVGEPPADYTWDQYVDYLRSAKDRLPSGTYAVGSQGSQQNAFYAYSVANGVEVFTADGGLGFDADHLTSYWQMWLDLQRDGVALPPDMAAEQPPGADQGYLATGTIMVDGLPGNSLAAASATIGGRPGGGTLKSFRYPNGSAGIGNILVASGFGIAANCDNISTAAAFINFFTNDVEGQVAFAADNGAPTNTDALDALTSGDEISELKKAELAQYAEIVELGPPRVIYPPGFNAVFQQAFSRNYNEAAFGRLPLAQAVTAFLDETNASLG